MNTLTEFLIEINHATIKILLQALISLEELKSHYTAISTHPTGEFPVLGAI